MRIGTALKHLRSLHEAEVETGNMKEARALEEAIAIMTVVKNKPLLAKIPLFQADEIMVVDNMFLRDICQLKLLGADADSMRRRALRTRVLDALDNGGE